MPSVKHAKTVLSVLTMLVLLSQTGLAVRKSSHRDKSKLPGGCGSCHVGHGEPGTPMLPKAEEKFCYICHGYGRNEARLETSGRVAPDMEIQNMEYVFDKQSRHPVEYEGLHIYGEEHLETVKDIPRHAECTDCHGAHYGEFKYETSENLFSDLERHRDGVRLTEEEFVLCYKCHSSKNMFGSPGQDVDREFDPDNPSYHPVEDRGRSNDVPSLKGFTESSLISCSDCHGNSDPEGPAGPHGSDYPPLLIDNYSMRSGPESHFSYALCYRCHSRDSILRDESFAAHRLHVVTVGASCNTCHNAHGSRMYPHLIEFDRAFADARIEPDRFGRLDYVSTGSRTGECYLTCHGIEHSPKTYSP